jgi:phage shock protein PspC (stress-responsive transcriptional regulator)
MDDMEQTDTSATGTSERVQQRQELVRPLNGRIIAGVSQGVADNFGISEWIPRLFFIVTAFMGGLGVALYAAGWAFIRSEDESTSPAERFFAGAAGPSSWVGLGLIVLAGLILLTNFTILAGEVVWAGVFLVVGLLLYLGYIPGWSRSGSKGDSTADLVSESKEGVQQMTATDTPADTLVFDKDPSGDSPAGGSTPPPTPTPPPPPRPPAPPRERSMLGRLTLGVVAIGLGVLALLDNVPGVAIEPEPYHYVALAVTIIGVGLMVGAFVGRARWLILIAALLVPTLAFSSFWTYDWESRDFNLNTTPLTFSEVQSGYGIDLGNMRIDLTELPWDGEEIDIEAAVEAGNMEIVLPDEVGIIGTATVDVGRISEPGRSTGGLGEPTLTWNDPGPDGTVLLDAHVDLGNITIIREG